MRIKGHFDLRELLNILLRRKWPFLVPVVIVTSLALAGSYYVAPLYESSVVLYLGSAIKLSTDVERMLGEFRDALGSPSSQGSELRDLAREITSLPYLSLVITQLGLDQDSSLNVPAARLAATQPDWTVKEAKIYLVADAIRSKIRLEFVGQNHLKVYARSRSAMLARDFANTLGEVYIREKSRNNLSSVLESLNFSYEQLKHYQEDLNAKIAEKVEIEQQVNRWKADEAAASDANRKTLTGELERAKQELEGYQATEKQLVATFDKLAMGRLVLPPSNGLTQREAEYGDALADLGSLGSSFPWRDERMAKTLSQLAGLGDDVEVEQERLVRSGWPNLDPEVRDQLNQLFGVRSRMRHLEAYIHTIGSIQAELARRAELLPQYLSKLERLTQEVETARTLSERFKTQQESFEISQAVLQQSRFEIVERALLNPEPVWPKRGLILLFGLGAGLLLGAAAVFVIEYSDRSLRSSEEVTEWLQIPVLGVVPKIEGLRKAARD